MLVFTKLTFKLVEAYGMSSPDAKEPCRALGELCKF